MNPEHKKAVARKFLEEVINEGKFDVLDDIMAPDYLEHDSMPGMAPGIAGVKQVLTAFRSAFPDLRFTIEDQIAEGDRVVTRWVFRGKQQGELFGIPPTGKPVEVKGVSIHQIVEGKLQQAWINYDVLGLMQQLGVSPPTAE